MILGSEVKWLELAVGQKSIFHQGDYLSALQIHLDQLLLTYQWTAPAAYGMTSQESLALCIILPGDALIVSEKIKNDMMQWILAVPNRCASLHFDTMANLLFTHFQGNTDATPTLLFDALDNETLLCTNFENDFNNELPRLIFDFGKKQGITNIFNTYIADFEEKNIFLNEKNRANLWQYLSEYPTDRNLVINYLDKKIEHQISIKISETRYFDLLTKQRNLLKNIFYLYKNFHISKINLIFVSDFFDNGIFRTFITYLLQQEFKINASLFILKDEHTYELLLKLMYKKTKKQTSYKNDERSKQRQRFFKNIEQKCVEKKKYRDYTQQYLPQGREIGIPDDVVIWHIRQALHNSSKLGSLGTVIQKNQTITYTPFNEKISEYLPLPQPPKLPIVEYIHTSEWNQATTEILEENIQFPSLSNHSTTKVYNPTEAHEPNAKADLQTVLALSHYFVIQKWLNSSQFLLFRGKLKQESENLVFRILKSNADPTQQELFNLLHEREASYYTSISPMLEGDFGRYYTRPYLEGEGLEKYVKRNGIDKKLSYNDLTSSDLELILSVWREAKKLEFCCPLKTRNFIVTTHRSLTLKKNIDVKIIDFNTADLAKDQFENDIHQLFEKLLGKNLYHEFQYHLQNQDYP